MLSQLHAGKPHLNVGSCPSRNWCCVQRCRWWFVCVVNRMLTTRTCAQFSIRLRRSLTSHKQDDSAQTKKQRRQATVNKQLSSVREFAAQIYKAQAARERGTEGLTEQMFLADGEIVQVRRIDSDEMEVRSSSWQVQKQQNDAVIGWCWGSRNKQIAMSDQTEGHTTRYSQQCRICAWGVSVGF